MVVRIRLIWQCKEDLRGRGGERSSVGTMHDRHLFMPPTRSPRPGDRTSADDHLQSKAQCRI